MDKKNIILVAVLITMLGATGMLLYRAYSNRPLSLVTPTVSDDDVIIRNQIDSLDVKIKKAVKKIDTGGSLDELINSQQFQELSSDSIRPIIIGNYGRINPFLPPVGAEPLITP